MKKISFLLCLMLLCAIAISFFAPFALNRVNAEGLTNDGETITETEGENPPVDGEIDQTDEQEPTDTEQGAEGEQTPSDTPPANIPTEEEPTDQTPTEEPTVNLTQEELTEILNSALNEQQQNIANLIAGKIADFFGVNYETVYIVVAGALVIIIIIIVLFVQVLAKRGNLKAVTTQLKATQEAYSELNGSKEYIEQVLNKLSAEDIGQLVAKALNEQSEAVINAIAEAVITKLKIDGDTLAKLLGGNAVMEEQLTALSNALLAIAQNNKDLAVKCLSKAPTAEVVNKITLENQQLKTVLGEEAVKQALSDKKAQPIKTLLNKTKQGG